ncbi:HU family DNA-binding protein [uncultured Bacteroides sp.]|uniref:HU family DNA-binding protein n=2 Tax=uncultured Bacteroides sp. TaxID=162156 RepID=UPI0025987F8E|nr:HU family DNA-binding protein [uncultured Bacteroides sp.]
MLRQEPEECSRCPTYLHETVHNRTNPRNLRACVRTFVLYLRNRRSENHVSTFKTFSTMPVSYSVSGRKKPGDKNAPVKFYAQVQASDECPFQTLTRTAADRSTVTAADAKAVMDNVMTVLKEKLAAGQIVRIDDLGSFRVAISTEGVEVAEKFTAANIKKARIVFTPCKELKNLCKTFEYRKTSPRSRRC